MSFKAEGENIVINIPDYDESAEIQKQLNEKERNENEEKRIAAENTRKSNESSRIAAENTRAKEHEAMKKEINNISNEVKNINLIPGPNGKSAYDIAVENGYTGTIEEWIESLNGEAGRKIIVNPGTFDITSNNPKTADINTPNLGIDVNVDDLVISFTKTADNKSYLCIYKVLSKDATGEYAYLRCQSCLDITPKSGEKGEKGDPGANGQDGTNGQDGHTPEKGTDYYTEAEKTELVNEVVDKVNEDIGLILDEINGEVV